MSIYQLAMIMIGFFAALYLVVKAAVVHAILQADRIRDEGR